jgi:hypothetical protein
MNLILAPAPSEPAAIAAAAEALGISEFDFFRVAFRRWSGREPDEQILEKVFVRYMFLQSAPHWTRHLCREVLHLRKTGGLDPGTFDLAGVRRRHPAPMHGRFSWRLMALALVLMALTGMDTTYPKDRRAPPGCPGSSGSVFLDVYIGPLVKGSRTICPPARADVREAFERSGH